MGDFTGIVAKKHVEIYGTWLAESQHEFLSYTRAMCYGLIERLNLLDCNPIRSVQEEKSGEYYHLTGWRRKSEGELRFDGVKRRMYCLGYLGTPSMIFYMKRYDRNEWFKGSVQHTAVSFCQLWLCAPSLLLAAAYGILTILPVSASAEKYKNGIWRNCLGREHATSGSDDSVGNAERIFKGYEGIRGYQFHRKGESSFSVLAV